MAFNFPSSPTIGQEANGYIWDGEKWVVVGSGGGAASDIAVVPVGGVAATDVQAAIAELDAEKVAKAGDTMTGPLVLHADPAVPLGAATKQYVDANVGGPAPIGVFNIADFGPTGTANDLATFQAAIAFAAGYGKRIGIKLEPTHTLVDNTASDGYSLLIQTNHVYFVAADGGTVLTLQSTSPNSRSFFSWYGGASGSYTLAANAAADATDVVLTSGASWAAGDFLSVFQTSDGAGNARSFIREVKSVAGATLTLKDAIPFAIATTHTLVVQRIPATTGGFVVGGGFIGNFHFDGSGVTGDNTKAVFPNICRQWSYDNLSFDGFKGTTPITGATGALYLNVGYDNRGGHLRLKNSGSGNVADVTYAQQCFGTFGDITDEAPAGFGPVITYGSRCSFGHHRVSGALQTRSYKLQGAVQHQISSIDVSNGAATGIYIVLGSDGIQIGLARAHKCVGWGFTIADSNNVQVGVLDARANDLDISTGNASGQIGVAYVSATAKVSLGALSKIDIGKLHAGADNKTYSYEKGVLVGVPISWVPTISSTGGALASVTPIAAFYTRIGRSVTCLLDFTIADKGTGNSDLQVSLPVQAFTAANGYAGGQALNGQKTLSGRLASDTAVNLRIYDGTSAIVANGDRFFVQIQYQANDFA